MSVFDLFPTEQATKLEIGRAADLTEGAGFFEGALSAPLKGAAKGLLVEPARVLNLGMSHIPAAIDNAFGTSTRDWWFENMMLQRTHRAVAPNPRETGLAGQILHSLFDVGSQAIVAGPSGVAVSKTVGGAIEGVEQGLDASTALRKGAIEGGAASVGVALPISIAPVIGSRIPALLQQLGYGVASNVPLGIAQRALTSQVLADAGYKDMAEQYKGLDEGALITDLVLGVAFGGLGHAIQSKGARLPLIRPSDVDAALAKRNAYHIEVDTAPGIARNGETRDAHVDSVMKATQDMIEGRPVDVSQTLTARDFQPHPGIDAGRAELAKVVEGSVGMQARRLLLDEMARHDREQAALGTPGFLRTPEDLIALQPREQLALPAELQRAIEIAKKPGFERTAEEKVLLDAVLSGRAGDYLTNPDQIARIDAAVRGLPPPAQKPGALVESVAQALGEPVHPPEVVHEALRAEGVEPTQENVDTVQLIARAREVDAAAVDALPPNLSDAAYLAKIAEIANAKQKTEAPGADRVPAGNEGPGAAGRTEPGQAGREGPETAGRPAGEAGQGGQGAGGVEAAEIRSAEEIAAESPDLPIVQADGSVMTAREALAKADEVIAQAKNDAQAFEAAVLCAIRRGE